MSENGFFCIKEESTFQGLLIFVFLVGLSLYACAALGARRYARASGKTRRRYQKAKSFLQVFQLVGLLLSVGTVVYVIFHYGKDSADESEAGGGDSPRMPAETPASVGAGQGVKMTPLGPPPPYKSFGGGPLYKRY